MIPCKVFLQAMEILPDSARPNKPKINLTFNSIFYDDIKVFQTKYFCLAAHDAIGVEAILEESDKIVGSVIIQNAYRLALSNETITLTIHAPANSPLKQLRLTFSLETVSSFKARNFCSTKKYISNGNNEYEDNLNSVEMNQQLQISFSHRDQLIQTNSLMNYQNLFPLEENIPCESLKTLPQESESLESLAQQRQKILGELFERFRREK